MFSPNCRMHSRELGIKRKETKNNLLIDVSDVDLKYFFLFFGDETVRNTIYLLFYFRDVDLKCFFLNFPKIGHLSVYGDETKRKNSHYLKPI